MLQHEQFMPFLERIPDRVQVGSVTRRPTFPTSNGPVESWSLTVGSAYDPKVHTLESSTTYHTSLPSVNSEYLLTGIFVTQHTTRNDKRYFRVIISSLKRQPNRLSKQTTIFHNIFPNILQNIYLAQNRKKTSLS